jgi:hypothetical protein
MSIILHGQPNPLLHPPDSLQTTLLFSAPIYVLVQVSRLPGILNAMDNRKHLQIFFANRVRVLSGRVSIFYLCGLLTLLRFACSMGMLVLTYMQGLAILQVKYRWLMATALSLGATVDIVIAVSMCYCLWQLRNSMYQRYVSASQCGNPRGLNLSIYFQHETHSRFDHGVEHWFVATSINVE